MTIPRISTLVALLLCVLYLKTSNAGIAEQQQQQQPITIMETIEYKEDEESQKDDPRPKSFEMETVEIKTDIDNQTRSLDKKVREIKNFQVTIKYFTKEMSLQMEENKVTLQGGVKLIYFAENGTKIVADEEADNCKFYQGHIINETDSTAAISICNEELEGAVLTDDQRYMLKPANRAHKIYTIRKEGVFVFGPHSVMVYPKIHDGNNKYGYVRIPLNETSKERSRRNALDLSETKYVELYLVNDKSEFVWLGSNTANNMRRMKQVTNLMDSFYQPHNIRIVFKALEVWNDWDKFTITQSIDNTLTTFLNYRKNTITPKFHNDNAMLVSRIDFTGPTIGLAPLSAMCREDHSGSVNQDTHNDFGNVASVMTHEMGHNFGMDHDTAGCVCHGRYGVCLMSPYAQDPIAMKFSKCSEVFLENYLKAKLGGCLLNKPNTGLYHDEKLCGNNKLDPGEDCDCGYPGFCQNPCCDANTCKFTAGSQCYTGSCCNACKLKAAGTKCRDTSDQCDIIETCDGVKGDCSENLYKQNGTPCNEHNQNGYCYDGYCQTYNGQCKMIWGTSASGGDSACFSFLNGRGDQHGNCGISGNYYVRCNHADVNCGKTFCQNVPQNTYPIIGYRKSRSSVSFTTGGRVVYCYSGTTQLGKNQPNPSVMYNGIQCSNGRACLNQKCVPVSQIMTNPCPGNCNGHGTCTNKGTCLCEASWALPDCNSKVTTPAPTTPAPTTPAPTQMQNNNNVGNDTRASSNDNNTTSSSKAEGRSTFSLFTATICLISSFFIIHIKTPIIKIM